MPTEFYSSRYVEQNGMLAAIFWKFSNFINIVTDYSNAMNELTEECIRNILFSIGLRNEPKMMCLNWVFSKAR